MPAVATALVRHVRPSPGMVAEAVRLACDRLGEPPQLILLYLTADFSQNPEAELRAALRASACTQVFGCSAQGIFTEEDWVLDAPAAAVMALAPPQQMPTQRSSPSEFKFTLAAPDALRTHWLNTPPPRLGGVAGDLTGQGPFKVWGHGRIAHTGWVELEIPSADFTCLHSQGWRLLHNAGRHWQQRGHILTEWNGLPLPLWRQQHAHLLGSLPLFVRQEVQGMAQSQPVLDSQHPDGWLLAGSLHPEANVSVVTRCLVRAQAEVEEMLGAEGPDRVAPAISSPPDFVLAFSDASRGPWSYEGRDPHWQSILRAWPDCPLLGFYGNRQIVPPAVTSLEKPHMSTLHSGSLLLAAGRWAAPQTQSR